MTTTTNTPSNTPSVSNMHAESHKIRPGVFGIAFWCDVTIGKVAYRANGTTDDSGSKVVRSLYRYESTGRTYGSRNAKAATIAIATAAVNS